MIGPFGELPPWIAALAIVFATWRLTHLLSIEGGPFDILIKFRRLLGVMHDDQGYAQGWKNPIAGAFVCPWCLSIWVGPAMIGLWVLLPVAVLSLAASGAAILAGEVANNGRE